MALFSQDLFTDDGDDFHYTSIEELLCSNNSGGYSIDLAVAEAMRHNSSSGISHTNSPTDLPADRPVVEIDLNTVTATAGEEGDLHLISDDVINTMSSTAGGTSSLEGSNRGETLFHLPVIAQHTIEQSLHAVLAPPLPERQLSKINNTTCLPSLTLAPHVRIALCVHYCVFDLLADVLCKYAESVIRSNTAAAKEVVHTTETISTSTSSIKTVATAAAEVLHIISQSTSCPLLGPFIYRKLIAKAGVRAKLCVHNYLNR